MTVVPAAVTAAPGRGLARPGSGEFRFLAATAMAGVVLSIDVMLPAMAEIRADLGLAPGSTQVSGLVTAFFLGTAAAQVPFGIVADRYGRRTAIYAGLVLFVVGAVAAALAPNLGLMLVGRFIWGVGAAGPRVAAVAMVRDSSSGDQMAREMSFIMAVFILVPVLAPSLGALLLLTGWWRLLFWVVAGYGVVLALWCRRLPETLALEHRQLLGWRGVARSARVVVTTWSTVANALAVTTLFGAFSTWLASSEVITDEVFGLDELFPLVFGGLAVVMGLGMYFNGRLVARLGLQRMIDRVLVVFGVGAAGMVVVAAATDGRPELWAYGPFLAVAVGAYGVLVPNFNAAAMVPMGARAGSAAAIIGAGSMAVGAVVGALFDRAYDGTIWPLTTAFAGSAILCAACARSARAR